MPATTALFDSGPAASAGGAAALRGAGALGATATAVGGGAGAGTGTCTISVTGLVVRILYAITAMPTTRRTMPPMTAYIHLGGPLCVGIGSSTGAAAENDPNVGRSS